MASPALKDPEKLQVVVGNFMQKCVELILHARMMPLPDTLRRGTTNRWVRAAAPSPRARRPGCLCRSALRHARSRARSLSRASAQFNVESEELLQVHEELQAWQSDLSQPLQLDIFVDVAEEQTMRGALGLQKDEPALVLLERWRLHYEPLGGGGPGPSSAAAAAAVPISWPAFYKRFMVLLRSILAQLRQLPSYRFATNLSKLRGASGASPVQYAISLPRSPARPAPAGLGFAAGAKQFSFPPPDGTHGKLDVGVLYRPETLFAGRALSPSAAIVGTDSGAADGAAAAAAGQCLAAALISDYVTGAAPPVAAPRPRATSLTVGLGSAGAPRNAYSVQQVARREGRARSNARTTPRARVHPSDAGGTCAPACAGGANDGGPHAAHDGGAAAARAASAAAAPAATAAAAAAAVSAGAGAGAPAAATAAAPPAAAAAEATTEAEAAATAAEAAAAAAAVAAARDGATTAHAA